MGTAAEILAQSRYGGRGRRRREPTPEGGLLMTVLQGLAARRVFARRLGSGAFRVPKPDGGERFVRIGDKGLPDVVALLPGGRTLWIELKAPDGRLSRPQVEFRNACLATGNLHCVCRDWSDVEVFL